MSDAALRADASALWATGSLGTKAKRTRLLFGQVREDASVEAALLGRVEGASRAFAIASGGCTAFSLLAASDVELTSVDINPAQIHLALLKRSVLCELGYDDALYAIAVDARSAYAKVRPSLPADARSFWDGQARALSRGLARSGLVDANLARAMVLFRLFVHGRGEIDRMLGAPTLSEQRATYAGRFDSWLFRAALRLGLSKPLLLLVYGRAALRDLPPDFGEQMKRQLDEVFTRSPIADNGYLWQLFAGKYPEGDRALPLYLQRASFERVRAGLAKASLVHAEAATSLRAHRASFDFLALSNILEVSTPSAAAELLEAARGAVTEGALVCLRSIFPPRPFVAEAIARSGFVVDQALGVESMLADRSPFCRHITVLRAPGVR